MMKYNTQLLLPIEKMIKKRGIMKTISRQHTLRCLSNPIIATCVNCSSTGIRCHFLVIVMNNIASKRCKRVYVCVHQSDVFSVRECMCSVDFCNELLEHHEQDRSYEIYKFKVFKDFNQKGSALKSFWIFFFLTLILSVSINQYL